MPKIPAVVLLGLLAPHALAALPDGGYRNTILVASDASYKPTRFVDPFLLNGWGVSIRPPGAGGHFWTANSGSGTTSTYIGDVNGSPLTQDDLRVVGIGRGAGVRPDGSPTTELPQPTGQVYNGSPKDFIVSADGLTLASKFIFVTAEGTISGWSETPDPAHPGQFLRHLHTVVMVDHSQDFDDDRLFYTGCAITDFPQDNRLFVTNLTTAQVEVYDARFQRVDFPAGRFRLPNQLPDYVAWNIQYLHTGPNGEGRLWVAYCQTEEPWEQMTDTGEVAEFDLDGVFIRRLPQSIDQNPLGDGELRAPWGFAVAPDNFGPLSGALLVGNFGDGTIAAYDLHTAAFIDFLRDESGDPVVIDGLWGMTFGNGVRLGDLNALYYAAGPNNEQDGVFGSVRFAAPARTADFNRDGVIESADFFAFLAAFFAGGPAADVSGDGLVNSSDFFQFVACFFAGC